MSERCKPDKRFPNCCDCGVKLTDGNISTHQPIRCQTCWEAFSERTSDFLRPLTQSFESAAPPPPTDLDTPHADVASLGIIPRGHIQMPTTLPLKLTDLKPAPYNPRKITAEAMAGLKTSLVQFGDISGIVWNSRTGNLVCGHQRLASLKALHGDKVALATDAKAGTARVETPDGQSYNVRVVDWPIETERAANVAANSPHIAGEFNDGLGDLLKAIQEDDAALFESLRFDAFDFPAEEPEGLGDPDAPAPEPPADPITQPGDLIILGNHRLLCGDSTKAEDVARLMGGEECDSVVSDPPYGINLDTDYRRFTTGFSVERAKHQKVVGDDKEFDPTPYLKHKHVVLFGANFYCKHLPLGSWLVWDKRFANGEAFLSDAELAWMKGGYGVYLKSLTSQGCIRPEKVEHPTQKPVAIMEWAIEMAKATDPIMDPFCGSGTTIIAAEKLSRRCYAMEISPAYCDVIVTRWEKFTGRTAERPQPKAAD